MHILCPHCRNPIEVVKLTPREEIGCPSCGSSFRLETDSTTGWQPGGEPLGKFELLDTVCQGAFACQMGPFPYAMKAASTEPVDCRARQSPRSE